MRKQQQHTHKAVHNTEFCSCGATRTNAGEWTTGKDPHAVAMGKKSLAMSTPAERERKASSGGEARWKGTTAKERRAIMHQVASRPRPNRRIEDRCECGRYSREYAEKRKHVCGKALEALLEGSGGR